MAAPYAVSRAAIVAQAPSLTQTERIMVSRWLERLDERYLTASDSRTRDRYAELLRLQIEVLGTLEGAFRSSPPEGRLLAMEMFQIDRLRAKRGARKSGSLGFAAPRLELASAPLRASKGETLGVDEVSAVEARASAQPPAKRGAQKHIYPSTSAAEAPRADGSPQPRPSSLLLREMASREGDSLPRRVSTSMLVGDPRYSLHPSREPEERPLLARSPPPPRSPGGTDMSPLASPDASMLQSLLDDIDSLVLAASHSASPVAGEAARGSRSAGPDRHAHSRGGSLTPEDLADLEDSEIAPVVITTQPSVSGRNLVVQEVDEEIRTSAVGSPAAGSPVRSERGNEMRAARPAEPPTDSLVDADITIDALRVSTSGAQGAPPDTAPRSAAVTAVAAGSPAGSSPTITGGVSARASANASAIASTNSPASSPVSSPTQYLAHKIRRRNLFVPPEHSEVNVARGAALRAHTLPSSRDAERSDDGFYDPPPSSSCVVVEDQRMAITLPTRDALLRRRQCSSSLTPGRISGDLASASDSDGLGAAPSAGELAAQEELSSVMGSRVGWPWPASPSSSGRNAAF